MAATFTTAEILAATRGTLIQGGAGLVFAGVSTDSRTCQAGELFIPLKGEKHDGHVYLPKALARGARGVLVEWKWLTEGRAGDRRGGSRTAPTPDSPQIPPDITVIAVPDTLTALGDLAQTWRSRFSLPVVAITGSCGKTTAKEMTARVLASAFRVLKNDMNLNNLIGLPHTLLELDAGFDAAVVEMGMNRFGEIRRLTEIARPTVGVLLNVAPAHTEGVGCVEGVARAKGELIGALSEDAVLVYNADDCRVAGQAARYQGPKMGFGLTSEAHVRAVSRTSQGRFGQTARVTWQGQGWTLTLPVPGVHMLLNALAATACGLALGLPPRETARALGGFAAIHRRSQVATLASGVNLLNDCYNANPASMAMALQTLQELRDGGRAAAALGDMLELGRHSEAEHRELGKKAAASGLDFLVIYGNFKDQVADGALEGGMPRDRVRPVADRAEGARILQEYLQPGDWVLVKGSRSMHMEQIVSALGG